MTPSDDQVRIARLEVEVSSVTRQLEALAPIAGQVVRATVQVTALTESVRDFREALREAEDELHASVRRSEARTNDALARIEGSCKSTADRLEAHIDSSSSERRAERTTRSTSRTAIIVALISATSILAGTMLEKAFGG